MMTSVLKFRYWSLRLCCVAGLMVLTRVSAFEIEYFGTTYGSRVLLQYAEKSHWDSFTWIYSPLPQGLHCQNDGNSGFNLGTQPFRIVPAPGESPSGQVEVRFGFATDELIQQAFTNFNPEVFDHHFEFGLRILNSGLPQGDEPITPLLNTGGGLSYVTLSVPVGATVFFDLVLDATKIHDLAPTFDTCLWMPQVLDPNNPGFARTSIFGSVSLISMEVVPEPGVGALVVVGALLLGRRFNSRRSLG